MDIAGARNTGTVLTTGSS